MKPLNVVSTALRVLCVCALYAILFVVTNGMTAPAAARAQFTEAQQAEALQALPLMAVLSACVLSYLVLRSRWYGAKLAASLALAFYVVHTALQQVETLAFPAVSSRMPQGTVPSLFLGGAIFAALLAPAAVFVLGKWSPVGSQPSSVGLPASPRVWLVKLGAGALLYVVIYFTFGYYIAWRTPGLPEFYGGRDLGAFFAQLGEVFARTPWLFPLQLVRGLVWTLVAVLLSRMLAGSVAARSLAVGAFFSFTVASQLLLPNPYMPPFIARAHQLEIFLSNFLLGALLVPLILYVPRAANPATRPAHSH